LISVNLKVNSFKLTEFERSFVKLKIFLGLGFYKAGIVLFLLCNAYTAYVS